MARRDSPSQMRSFWRRQSSFAVSILPGKSNIVLLSSPCPFSLSLSPFPPGSHSQQTRKKFSQLKSISISISNPTNTINTTTTLRTPPTTSHQPIMPPTPRQRTTDKTNHQTRDNPTASASAGSETEMPVLRTQDFPLQTMACEPVALAGTRCSVLTSSAGGEGEGRPTSPLMAPEAFAVLSRRRPAPTESDWEGSRARSWYWRRQLHPEPAPQSSDVTSRSGWAQPRHELELWS